MTKAEFDKLPSDGRVVCPKCGFKSTTPYPGCHCPPNRSGYGTNHINEYHHSCRYSALRILERAPRWVKELLVKEQARQEKLRLCRT